MIAGIHFNEWENISKKKIQDTYESCDNEGIPGEAHGVVEENHWYQRKIKMEAAF